MSGKFRVMMNARSIGGTRKHRYFLPLTPRMKEVALNMQKSYRKRVTSKTMLRLESIQEGM